MLKKTLNTWFWLQAGKVFSEGTIEAMKLDLRRFQVRRRYKGKSSIKPDSAKLHVGCGNIHVKNWLNVDLYGSDFNVDLATSPLPWSDNSFDAAISQHVIEHLVLESELIPLLNELSRVMTPGAELWLSCPDIEKVCTSYMQCNMQDLLEDRRQRWPDFPFGEMPTSHLINHFFSQEGGHKNLFDFALLEWTLKSAGFDEVEQNVETDLLMRFPEFPKRGDDAQSIYVSAKNAKTA